MHQVLPRWQHAQRKSCHQRPYDSLTVRHAQVSGSNAHVSRKDRLPCRTVDLGSSEQPATLVASSLNREALTAACWGVSPLLTYTVNRIVLDTQHSTYSGSTSHWPFFGYTLQRTPCLCHSSVHLLGAMSCLAPWRARSLAARGVRRRVRISNSKRLGAAPNPKSLRT